VYSRSRSPLLALTAFGAAAAVGVGYAAGIERNAFVLREATLPVLDPGSPVLRVLHISDLHMMPNQRRKQAWVRALDKLEPDLVVNTGDNLAHRTSVPAVVQSLGPLLDRPGLFVFGSNDYFAPKAKNPLKYFRPGHKRVHGAALPWRDLRAAFTERGWQDMTHVRRSLEVGGVRIAAAGVDDPHLKRDRYDTISGRAPADVELRLGLTHSPEPRVLDAFAADGYDLVLAGHTHGGQLCVPFHGALVTNCELDTSRVKGPSRWGTHTWLHVSAGLGTSPYAPVRFACRPEATLLTLVPAARSMSPTPQLTNRDLHFAGDPEAAPHEGAAT
jgi:predicted MPP superfamily phosphohydrolase